ncbi:hypothetical protein [Bradyrhizobium elkanii]|uniref:hypothetical protein n=1 Tax=Bradyrhizobium elkanii TaxID=29448 RepID=UPI00056F2599|nr:hypothetical protein [Bradyrhizobium elkanii]WLA79986.1 hypothetical protein QNJ99_32000 [Bradyrhizobium elkanii]
MGVDKVPAKWRLRDKERMSSGSCSAIISSQHRRISCSDGLEPSGSLAGVSEGSIERSADDEEDEDPELKVPWTRDSTSDQLIDGSAFGMKLMRLNTHSSISADAEQV